jgi:hypothetical protein
MSLLISGDLRLAKNSVAATDTNIREVSLLLHGNGTNSSTTITDSSLTPKTVTAFGNAQISTAESKFGGASIAFDGTGDYLTVPNSSDLQFGSGDFTIETWAYIQNSSSYTIVSYPVAGGLLIAFYAGLFRVRRYAVADVITTSSPPPLNAWTHIAVCKSGRATRLFFNGVQAGSTAADTSNYTVGTDLYIATDNAAFILNGLIDDLRITKGVARYTANFTPPTAPFPDF